MPISTVQYVLFYIAGWAHWFYHTCSYTTQTMALGIQKGIIQLIFPNMVHLNFFYKFLTKFSEVAKFWPPLTGKCSMFTQHSFSLKMLYISHQKGIKHPKKWILVQKIPKHFLGKHLDFFISVSYLCAKGGIKCCLYLECFL